MITQAALASGDLTTPGTSFATTSITPTANRLVLLAIHVWNSGVSITPPASVTGCGLTWVIIASEHYQVLSGVENQSVFLYRALGASPAAGAVTITTGGETWQELVYAVSEFAGVNTSGTNGSGAIVQSATSNGGGGSSTTLSVALTATDAANAAYGLTGINLGENISPGAGFTEIHDLTTAGIGLETQWKASGSVTGVDASWTTSSARGGIAVEIAAAAVGGGTASSPPPPPRRRLLQLLAR